MAASRLGSPVCPAGRGGVLCRGRGVVVDVDITSEQPAMFDAMSKRNDELIAARAQGQPATRSMRVIGPASMQRYRATLRAALNEIGRAHV